MTEDKMDAVLRKKAQEALAQRAAVQRETVERCANIVEDEAGHWSENCNDSAVSDYLSAVRAIRAIPLEPDAEAALKRHDAALIERCADAAEDYCSDMPDLAGHGHSIGIKEAIRALAHPTEGE